MSGEPFSIWKKQKPEENKRYQELEKLVERGIREAYTEDIRAGLRSDLGEEPDEGAVEKCMQEVLKQARKSGTTEKLMADYLQVSRQETLSKGSKNPKAVS